MRVSHLTRSKQLKNLPAVVVMSIPNTLNVQGPVASEHQRNTDLGRHGPVGARQGGFHSRKTS